MELRNMTTKINILGVHRVSLTLFWFLFIGVSAVAANNGSAAPPPGKSILEVQVIGDPDRTTWGDTRAIDVPMGLRFQWSTEVPGAHSAVWKVGNGPFVPDKADPYIVANGKLSAVPDPGRVSSFLIDFKSFLWPYRPDVTLSYYVRLWILDEHGKTLGTSNSVKVLYLKRTPQVEYRDLVTKLNLQFLTNWDDLRGGNDNVNVEINFSNGPSQSELNVNHGLEWKEESTHDVTIILNQPVRREQIKSITLRTTFAGGTFGDNWYTVLTASAVLGSGKKVVVAHTHWHRFTGDKPEFVVPVHWP